MPEREKGLEFKVGEMVMEDIDEVVRLQSHYSKEALERMIESLECICFTAKVAGKVVGFALTSFLREPREAEIHNIMVIEKFRKQGVAGDLLEATLAKLEGGGIECRRVFGDISLGDEVSKKLFEKHGLKDQEELLRMSAILPRTGQRTK